MDLLQKVDATLSGIYHDYLKLVKYLAVGAIGTIADWSVFYALIDLVSIYYLVAMAISYLVGMVINFFLNKHFTFENTYKKLHYQFASFAVIALIGLALQEAIMYGMVQYLFGATTDSMPLFAARVVATLVGFAWTFIANKKITFKIFQ
jgi:putative flippase GtrA